MYSPDTYRKRLVDDKINQYLKAFGAISLIGMRWTGKTTTGQAHCVSEISLADSTNNFSNKKLALASPEFVLKGETPRLIDEWQEVPAIWDATRFACDRLPGNGNFILTGSSSGNYSRDEIIHTGTGRIATITIGSMSLYETGDSSGMISLQELFDHPVDTTPTGPVEIEQLVRYCVRGGWPKNIDVEMDIAKLTPVEYIKTIIEKDFNDLPDVKNKRSPEKIQACLSTVAAFESTTCGTSDYSKNVKETHDISITRQTFEGYLAGFRRLFIIDSQPAFSLPASKTGSKLLKTAKVRFADPSLVVASLGYKPEMLLTNMDLFGRIFDSLCYHEMKIYAESIDASCYHLIEEHGNSVDSLIELNDGRIGCFKHVVASHQIDQASAELLRVKKILDNAGTSPTLLCVICGMSNAAYTRPDGVMVVPLTALKP